MSTLTVDIGKPLTLSATLRQSMPTTKEMSGLGYPNGSRT